VGRVRLNIQVKKRPCWTMFDTGSRNTYVNRDVTKLLVTSKAPEPRKVGLGGATRTATQMAFLEAKVDGHLEPIPKLILSPAGRAG
jgi:hypothetical protein